MPIDWTGIYKLKQINSRYNFGWTWEFYLLDSPLLEKCPAKLWRVTECWRIKSGKFYWKKLDKQPKVVMVERIERLATKEQLGGIEWTKMPKQIF